MTNRRTAPAATLLLAVAACADPGWVEVPETSIAIALPKKRAAERARDVLAQRLSRELAEALADQGVASGIEVCRRRAPLIAGEVREEFGLAIGRTSFRLRNAANRPPSWAAVSVQERSSDAKFFENRDGGLRALFPIRLAAQCVTCHGPAEALAAEVRAALAASYPSDAATGFAPGDLRGWFWVEVP